MRPRLTYANVAATLALVLAASGLAVAANPGSDGVVRGCVSKSTHIVRVRSDGKCSSSRERKLSWSKAGPPGMSAYEIVPGDTAPGLGDHLTADSSSTCPKGKKAVGGGLTTSGTTDNVNTVYSKPFGENQWIVQTAKHESTDGDYEMTAYAVCVKVAE